MPELPEVEATAVYLKERVVGCTISGSTVRWARSIAVPDPETFAAQILNKRISSVGRRGKFIWLDLGQLTLFIHLRMSGSIDVVNSASSLGTHDRIIIGLSSGKEIRFTDPRKFGRMYLVHDRDQVTGHLGVEPLTPEFSLAVLEGLLCGRRAQIKPLLLSQRLVAGLGNIYVDEVLWRAKIHPCALACSLNRAAIGRIHQSIRVVLNRAICLLGTDFGDGVVEGGTYRPQVYGRDGEPCRRCKAIIRRMVVTQRGTHVCPRCQGKPRL